MIGLRGVIGAGLLLAGSALASFALWNMLQNIVASPREIEVWWFAFTFAFSLPFLATGIWAIRSDRRELREDGWIE